MLDYQKLEALFENFTDSMETVNVTFHCSYTCGADYELNTNLLLQKAYGIWFQNQSCCV